ncbi:MAG: ATP-binding protein [Candidatus Shapirobacteria bacterium]
MIYKREICTRLEKEIETKEILIITGMRRVGKTTVLQYLFDKIESKNKVMLDLENPMHRKLFEEENYDLVWNNLAQYGVENKTKSYVLIDEVQNLPEISRVIKYLYDHWNVKFVLTGSSSYYLRNLFPESLSGRKVIFEMFPLDFEEFLKFKDVNRKTGDKNKIRYQKLIGFYDEYMEYGGFPGVVLEQNRERKKLLLQDIFTSYFEKDAKNLADFKDMSRLRDLIILLVSRIGSQLDIQKLALSLAVSRETVYNYLSFLEQTYFISLLPRFSGSPDRQAAGSKKIFFCDSGVANVIGKLSEGQLFEQSVYQNLRGKNELAFYNKTGGGEIDFIVNSKSAVEVKMTASRQDVSNLRKRCESLKIKNISIVTHEYSDLEETKPSVDL